MIVAVSFLVIMLLVGNTYIIKIGTSRINIQALGFDKKSSKDTSKYGNQSAVTNAATDSPAKIS